jgi:hypothetical protein
LSSISLYQYGYKQAIQNICMVDECWNDVK